MLRFSLVLLLFPFVLFGQQIINQDCGKSEPVCSPNFNYPPPPTGGGDINDLLNYSGCLDGGETNSAWFQFTVQTGGQLLFDLVPDSVIDYDFALFRLSQGPGSQNFDCGDIATGNLPNIRCNYSGTVQPDGITGLRNGYANTTATPSGPKFSAPLSVDAGEVYVLIVDNFNGASEGYTLDFSNSTASIIDVTPPRISSVQTGTACDPVQNIVVVFSELVRCDSLIIDNFSISGPQNVSLANVLKPDCNNSEQTFEVTLVLDTLLTTGGTYTITPQNIVDQCGNMIDPVSSAFDFTIYEIPEAIDSFAISESCFADTFFFYNLSDGVVDDVIWDFGDGDSSTMENPSHIFDSIGDYTVTLTVISPDSCVSQTSTMVNVLNSFQADFSTSTNNVCAGEEIQFFDETRGAPDTWSWEFGDGDTSDLQNPVHTYSSSGTYSVTLLAQNTATVGCPPDTITVEVDVLPNASASFSLEDTACQNQFIMFDSLPTSTTANYYWDFGNQDISNEQEPNYAYPNTGDYLVSLIVDDQFCGSDTASESLYVKPGPQFNLGPDTSICVSDQYVLRVEDQVDDIRWSDGSTNNSIVINDFPAQVSVEVLKNGCTATDQVFVGARRDDCYLVNIPTAFSPNGDGLNDLLKILPTRIEEFNMRVYNRWGELVYENPGLFNAGWDGTHNGDPQDVGVYTYYIEAVGMDGRTIRQSGNVTLLR